MKNHTIIWKLTALVLSAMVLLVGCGSAETAPAEASPPSLALLGSFLVGCVMNVCAAIFAAPLRAASLALRLCCLVFAPFFVGLGIALVKQSHLGLTPYDIVPLLLHRKAQRLPFSAVRIGVDAVSFLAGAIPGGTVGIGTVASVVLTGPTLQLASAALARAGKA